MFCCEKGPTATSGGFKRTKIWQAKVTDFDRTLAETPWALIKVLRQLHATSGSSRVPRKDSSYSRHSHLEKL